MARAKGSTMEGDPLFRDNFSSYERAKRDEIKLQCSALFEGIKRLVLDSAVKEYFCVHILKFYIVLSLGLNRQD